MNIVDKLEVIRRKRNAGIGTITSELQPRVTAEMKINAAQTENNFDFFDYDLGFQIWARVTCHEEDLGNAHEMALLQIKRELFHEVHTELINLLAAIYSNDRDGARDLVNKILAMIR